MINCEASACLTKDKLGGLEPSRLGISMATPQRRLDTLDFD